MKVFANSFYWIALTDSTGSFHVRASQVTDEIVPTDEVSIEYPAVFCGGPEFMRREVSLAVEDILQNPEVT